MKPPKARPMPDLNLAVIGNCSFSALVDQRGRIVWSCLPRVDGDPVFCSLLDENGAAPEAGFFDVVFEDLVRSEQFYLANTAVLVTRLHDAHGSTVEIVDFAPRFKRLGRFYRPATIMRRIVAIAGRPRIRVRLRPSV